MRLTGRLLLIATIIMPLIFSTAGCGVSSGVVLRDREQILPHPSDTDKVCLDKGYLATLFEELGKCEKEKAQ